LSKNDPNVAEFDGRGAILANFLSSFAVATAAIKLPRYTTATNAVCSYNVLMSQTASTQRTKVAHAWLLALALPTAALGQEGGATTSGPIHEIIVTAQKWEQSADTVGMAITAVTGEVLQERGITSVANLTRLVPGLTLQESSFNSTSFTLRGVGFFNSDLGTPPAVTVYVDEAPLPYPAMTKLAAFDLARVEVLKGPQGTLYGQNATGGAVNYIAAKPTEVFASGMDTTYGRFNRVQVGGFVSGPVTDRLGVRIAVQGRRGDPWQESITRPGDRLGKIRELQSRAIVEWRPVAQFASRLAFTMTHDGSESLAAQFIAPTPTIPALAVPGLLTFPVITEPRAADWTPTRLDTNTPFPYDVDTTLYQASWRNDYQLNDDVTITSLTSYADFRMAYGQDPDGTPFHVSELIDREGEVSAFFQELRLAGRQERINWLLGANYTRDAIEDQPIEFFRDNDVGRLFEPVNPQAFADKGLFTGRMRVRTYAAFGRVEFNVADRLMLEAALRHNVDRRTFDHCGIAISDHFVNFWNLIRAGAQPPTQLGDCWTLDPANAMQPADNVHSTLNENSQSWRAGLNWAARQGLLFYANVSKGYKAGTVPVLAASTVIQFTPVPQESLLAYEAGFKAGLFDRRAQLNASAFYYDYARKQLRGAMLDLTFGPLEALVSIPKSHVVGAEAQLVVRLSERLTLDTSAVYAKTQIDQFTGFDARAQFGDQSGTPFPFSPQWQSITNVDYEFPLWPTLKAFVGGSLVYNSETFAGVGALDLFRIDAFTLLDLRAGVELDAGRYRLWAWGKNVTDEYYWSNVFAHGNAISRFAGQPATYGVSLAARF
jgi:outer membrane receptor protein involved in Fe transport